MALFLVVKPRPSSHPKLDADLEKVLALIREAGEEGMENQMLAKASQLELRRLSKITSILVSRKQIHGERSRLKFWLLGPAERG